MGTAYEPAKPRLAKKVSGLGPVRGWTITVTAICSRAHATSGEINSVEATIGILEFPVLESPDSLSRYHGRITRTGSASTRVDPHTTPDHGVNVVCSSTAPNTIAPMVSQGAAVWIERLEKRESKRSMDAVAEGSFCRSIRRIQKHRARHPKRNTIVVIHRRAEATATPDSARVAQGYQSDIAIAKNRPHRVLPEESSFLERLEPKAHVAKSPRVQIAKIGGNPQTRYSLLSRPQEAAAWGRPGNSNACSAGTIRSRVTPAWTYETDSVFEMKSRGRTS